MTAVSSGSQAVFFKSGEGLIIGERINPTGKKALKEAYRNGDVAYILREAVAQVTAGAKILDVNCGVPGLDEVKLLDSTIAAVQSVVTAPIEIDTADPKALALALRRVNGKALVNSVNGKREVMDAVFPLVKKYGGVIVALCLDEDGIPATCEGRLEIAKRILTEGAKYGFGANDFLFDALTLSVSTDHKAALITLETVERLTKELEVNTVLGVSNVSFGLPNRAKLNNTMYALAVKRGLSAAIANPSVIKAEIDPIAEDVLLGHDIGCAKWIAANVNSEVKSLVVVDATVSLKTAIERGLKEDALRAAKSLIDADKKAMEIVDSEIVPALEKIGLGFERGEVFLPQLLMAADAAGEAFTVVRSTLKISGNLGRPIVLATVKGDIHDIGKNIVRALLENYGFPVIDLGRDVPPKRILEVAKESNAMMVGLSALMTTTAGAMAETVKLINLELPNCPTCVGGAVVTEEYAKEIGASFYAKDAMRTVRIAEELKTRSAK